MDTESAAQAQQKQREFMSLLPLTREIAGLASVETGKYFNEGQMDARMHALMNAYKVARQLMMEISK